MTSPPATELRTTLTKKLANEGVLTDPQWHRAFASVPARCSSSTSSDRATANPDGDWSKTAPNGASACIATMPSSRR